MTNQLNRPEDFNRFIGKKVKLVQRNRVEVIGKVTIVSIDKTEKVPHSLAIEQNFFRSTKVGKIKPTGDKSIATVYLKNISRIEVL
jgi:ribosome maturation factor RimP